MNEKKKYRRAKTYDIPVESDLISSLIMDYLRSWGPIKVTTLSPAIPGVVCVCVCVCVTVASGNIQGSRTQEFLQAQVKEEHIHIQTLWPSP